MIYVATLYDVLTSVGVLVAVALALVGLFWWLNERDR